MSSKFLNCCFPIKTKKKLSKILKPENVKKELKKKLLRKGEKQQKSRKVIARLCDNKTVTKFSLNKVEEELTEHKNPTKNCFRKICSQNLKKPYNELKSNIVVT